MLARAFEEGEAPRRCACGHVMVAKVGDMCPRPGCHRLFPDVRAIHNALVFIGHSRGPAELARMAPVLGVEGAQYLTDGERVFGVVGGGR